LNDDPNGSGGHDNGEIYVGAGMVFPVWIEGDPPPAYQARGLTAGWNAVEMDFDSGGDFTVWDPLAIPLSASLWPNETLTIGGTYGGTADITDQRLALLPSALFDGVPVSSFLYNAPLTDPWSITITSEPPADHQEYDSESGLFTAGEIPASYVDESGDGVPGKGDQLGYFTCYDGMPVVAMWLSPALTLETAYYLAAFQAEFGWQPGWYPNALDMSGKDPVPVGIDPADWNSLELSADCGLF
jgi:hypothetical protein